MDRKLIEKTRDSLHDALEEIMLKGIKTDKDIECTKNALAGLKDAEEILGMGYDDGKSGRIRPWYGTGYEGSFGRSYDNSDYSGRGRSMGGYDRRYSGHDMRERLEMMLDEATSENERRAIREALQKM